MELPRFISTNDVPHQFLKAASLIGSIPFKALHTDPRVSYTLYIPPDHYNPDPSLQHSKDPKNLCPAYQLPLLPLVVSIHSTNRGAESCRNRLIPFANRFRVAVLAPLFPASIDSFNDLENYKLLRYKSLHADTVLFDILDEVKVRWPGIATEKVYMIGFSGGGQFVQRFLYLYPEKLYAASVGSPGRVTYLDQELKWPFGIKDVAEVFDGTVIDKDKIREVKLQLVVGADDTEVHGGPEFWAWKANKEKELVKEKVLSVNGASSEKLTSLSEGRVSILKRLRLAWERDDIQCEFGVVDGAKHEVDKIFPAVVEFLRPLIIDQWART